MGCKIKLQCEWLIRNKINPDDDKNNREKGTFFILFSNKKRRKLMMAHKAIENLYKTLLEVKKLETNMGIE